MASSMAIRCSQPPKLLFSPLFKVRSLQHLNNKTRILPKTLSTSAIPNVYQTTSPPSHSSDQRFYRDELGNPPPPHHQSTSQPGNFIPNQRTQNQQYPPPNHYNYPNAVYPNQGCAYPNQEGYPQQHQHQYQTPNPWNQNYPQQDNQWNQNYSQHQNPPQVRRSGELWATRKSKSMGQPNQGYPQQRNTVGPDNRRQDMNVNASVNAHANVPAPPPPLSVYDLARLCQEGKVNQAIEFLESPLDPSKAVGSLGLVQLLSIIWGL